MSNAEQSGDPKPNEVPVATKSADGAGDTAVAEPAPAADPAPAPAEIVRTPSSPERPPPVPQRAAPPLPGVKRKRDQTFIGIAPPAAGSQTPPPPPPDEPSSPPTPPAPTAAVTKPSFPSPSSYPPAFIPTPRLPMASVDHPLAATTKSLGVPAPPSTLTAFVSREPPISTIPPAASRKNTLIGGTAPAVPRRMTPMGGTSAPILTEKVDRESSLLPSPPGAETVPPIIRVPQGGMLGGSAPARHERAGTLICEILVRNGSVSQQAVDKGLALQEERGGQIGRILVSMGACTEEAIAGALVEQLRVRKEDGYATDVSAAARENKDVAGLKVLTRPGRTVMVIVATDVVSLLLAALIATGLHWARTYGDLGELDWSAWLVVGPAVALCMLTYLGLELYSPMAKSTPDEIRDVVFASSLVHFGASMLSTLGDLPIVKWGLAVRGTWWLATLFLVPVLRSLVRNKFSVQAWWGIPVCVLGAAKTGRLIVRTLKAQPRSGLKPVMLLDDDAGKHGTLRASFTNEVMDVYSINVSASHFMSDAQRKALSDDIFGTPEDDLKSGPISSDHIPTVPPSAVARGEGESEFFGPDSAKPRSQRPAKDASLFPRGKFAEVEGVPVVGDLSLAPILAQRLKIPHAVVAMPGVDSHKLVQIVERIGGKFSHLLIIPDLFGFATVGVPAKNVGGILGVEVRQQLLLPGPRLAKRVMDFSLTCLGSIFVAPFLVLIALLIKLDSKGPIFYTQKRLGKDGEHFQAYKFRTMHGDGEERLKAILDADPELRAEYEVYHKLKKDPRVTRIGRVLRKFSLDEFPQLLNVLKGDMTLVGPRPYIERELTAMGGQEKIILRAPPGMTGMWQVSDRNATSFAQRVQIDVYYVRNWSPWLDIHILAKTFGVVIKGSGV